MSDKPIEVNQNAMPAHLMSLLRDALVAGTTWLTAQGYVDAVTGTNLVSIGMLVGTVLWRQYVTAKTHQKLLITANAAPNDTARVV